MKTCFCMCAGTCVLVQVLMCMTACEGPGLRLGIPAHSQFPSVFTVAGTQTLLLLIQLVLIACLSGGSLTQQQLHVALSSHTNSGDLNSWSSYLTDKHISPAQGSYSNPLDMISWVWAYFCPVLRLPPGPGRLRTSETEECEEKEGA